MHKSREIHCKTVLRILVYMIYQEFLKNGVAIQEVWSYSPSLYSNAGSVGDRCDRKSITGYLIFVGG